MIHRAIGRLILWILFFSPFVALVLVLEHYVRTIQFEAVGAVALTPLAILIGLSGLMYNRTRAIENRRARFRSLYAAERLLAATLFYLLALILAFVPTVFLWAFESSISREARLLVFGPSILFCLWSFAETMNAIQGVSISPFFAIFGGL